MRSNDKRRARVAFLWTYFLQSIGLIVLIGLLIRVFIISSFVMSGNGMVPTVWPGDFLVGVKSGIFTPRRGDVLALNCSRSDASICIKRLIAIEGDRVEYTDGQFFLNGEPLRRRTLNSDWNSEGIGERNWVVMAGDSSGGLRQGPLVIPPGYAFVVNDRREDRNDSRTWGPVPLGQIESRVSRVWLSLDWYDKETLRDWPSVRWSRLLHRVD